MKELTGISLLILLVSFSLITKNEKVLEEDVLVHDDPDCTYAFGPKKAIECAQVAYDISGFSGDWPPNTNSTVFFELIAGNKNLTRINFCNVFIDSLTPAIGDVPNLESLQLSRGNITKIPKEIGKLKKLKKLILGTSRDECRGNKVKDVPKEIGNCTALEHLGLAFSEVEDLPIELNKCENLKVIDLSYNEVITNKTLRQLRKRLPHVEVVFKK